MNYLSLSKFNFRMANNTIDLYQVKEKMYVATDCIIFGFHEGKLKLLFSNEG